MERRFSEFFDRDTAARAGFSGSFAPPGAESDPVITSLEYDSRRAGKGSLYGALPGLHVDGHSFIAGAVRRGALAVVYQHEIPEAELASFGKALYVRVQDSRFAMSPLADSFQGRPSGSLAVIGITGTEGKSTTTYLIWQLLRLAGKKAGFISTVQYSTGGEAFWNPEHQTTPEAVTIHARLAEMRDAGAEFAVLESSSHGLSPRTNRLGDVVFDAGVMTNVAHEHLEFHGTREQYRDDKANLFRALARRDRICAQKSGLPRFGTVNADDESAGYFEAAAGDAPVFRYSTGGARADISLRGIESRADGNSYSVVIGGRLPGGSRTAVIEDRLPGAFNAGNVLASLISVSALLEKDIETLIPLVPRLLPVRGRMTAVRKGQPFEVLVDYAHTPSSFQAIFPPLRERLSRTGGRIISVFGSAGERDTAKRPAQGKIAGDYSDLIILADEDPRGEDPVAILREIAAGCGLEKEKIFLLPDRALAIRKAFSLARAGDLVLLLGKGHENTIIYEGNTIPWDEIAEAEKALAETGFRS